ncbi:putative transmembrane protein [Raphanus sativus]|nr:putative transmembrane protein [Raphanus sativus]
MSLSSSQKKLLWDPRSGWRWSSDSNDTKQGSSNHNVTNPGTSNHNVTKPGSSNHNHTTSPGSSNHNHHNVTKPGSSNHNHNVTKPGSSNHNHHNVTKPGSSNHNHNVTKPGSSKHNDTRSGSNDNSVFAKPREVVVGGSSGWNYGVDLEEWASKTTFHVGDVLVFEYSNMTNRRHDVYLQTNLWSYRTCNIESRNKIASSEDENGSKESFKFTLAMSQPYSFACGEDNGFYCRTYNMKFSVLPDA